MVGWRRRIEDTSPNELVAKCLRPGLRTGSGSGSALGGGSGSAQGAHRERLELNASAERVARGASKMQQPAIAQPRPVVLVLRVNGRDKGSLLHCIEPLPHVPHTARAASDAVRVLVECGAVVARWYSVGGVGLHIGGCSVYSLGTHGALQGGTGRVLAGTAGSRQHGASIYLYICSRDGGWYRHNG